MNFLRKLKPINRYQRKLKPIYRYHNVLFQTFQILTDLQKLGYRENQLLTNPLPVILHQLNQEKLEHRELKKFLLPMIWDRLGPGRPARTGPRPRTGPRAERERDR